MKLSEHNRIGFTLVELLFVVAIIAVLATMSLGIMKSAQDDAKEAATRARILQIESILQIELEDYEVRRLPVSIGTLAGYVRVNSIYGGTNISLQVRNLRRRILTDMISAEFPRPIAAGSVFVVNPDVGVFPTESAATVFCPNPDPRAPKGFWEWLGDEYPNPFPGTTVNLRDLLRNQASAGVQAWRQIKGQLNFDPEFNLPGEYLYATLSRMDIDGSPAIESLGNQAVGDSDNDGFLEVIDAWGDPLQLRIWQVCANEVDSTGTPVAPSWSPVTDIWEDVPVVDFDQRGTTAFEFENTNGDIEKAVGIPTGYTVLDPKVPREISKIRFEVVSTRLIQ